MITVVSDPTTPLRSFTPTIYGVVSDDPLTEKMQGTFAGYIGNTVGVDNVRSITLYSQVSVGSTSLFEFDLQEFLRDNLTYDIRQPETATAAYPANNSIFTTTIQQYAEQVSVNGQLVTGDTLTTLDTFITINATRQAYEPETLGDYIMNVGGKFLTNSPRRIDIRTDESYVLSVYVTDATNFNKLFIAFLDNTGAVISNTSINYTQSGRYDIPVGVANLIAAGVSVPSGTASYNIAIGTSIFPLSEVFNFRVIEGCSDTLRVHFLNRMGGFDTFTFDTFKEQVQTNTSVFEKNLGTTFDQQSRGRTPQYRTAFKSYVATSEILSAAKSAWLEELVTSPLVYVEQDGLLYPVVAADRNFLVTDRLVLKQLEMTFILANDIRNQRL